jgi:hypothetical protein
LAFLKIGKVDFCRWPTFPQIQSFQTARINNQIKLAFKT